MISTTDTDSEYQIDSAGHADNSSRSRAGLRPTANSKSIFCMAIVVSAIVALPSTYLYFAAPFVALLWFIFDVRVLRRFILAIVSISALSITAILLDASRGMQVNYPGVWVGLITYSPWMMFFALQPRFKGPVFDEAWRGFLVIVALFVIGQALLGLVEFAILRDGDMVSGTFGLLNALQGKRTISQVHFTFTMFACLLLLSCFHKGALNRLALALGSAAVAAAQSGHQTVFLLVAIMVVVVIAHRKAKVALQSGVIVGVAWTLVLAFSPNTTQVAMGWWDKVVLSDSSIKRHITSAAFANLTDPKTFLIGTGVGQFSSRASLITSGQYLTAKIPEWMIGNSAYYRNSVEPEFLLFQRYGEQSAMSQPYFSCASFPVEFGIPVTLAVALVVLRTLRTNNTRARGGGEAGRLAVAANIFIVFFVLCCAIENYAEMVQAITIPLLLLLLVEMRVRHLAEEGADHAGGTATISLPPQCEDTDGMPEHREDGNAETTKTRGPSRI